MSRYSLYQFVQDADDLEEYAQAHFDYLTRETNLQSWLEEGFLGWDEPMETYFLQGPELRVGDKEGPIYWFGVEQKEILSPYALVTILNTVFPGVIQSPVVINPKIIELLLRERNDSMGISSELQKYDQSWLSGKMVVSSAYVRERLYVAPGAIN